MEESGLPLEEDEMHTLMELGNIIGRYDADGQRESLSLARERIDRFLHGRWKISKNWKGLQGAWTERRGLFAAGAAIGRT